MPEDFPAGRMDARRLAHLVVGGVAQLCDIGIAHQAHRRADQADFDCLADLQHLGGFACRAKQAEHEVVEQQGEGEGGHGRRWYHRDGCHQSRVAGSAGRVDRGRACRGQAGDGRMCVPGRHLGGDHRRYRSRGLDLVRLYRGPGARAARLRSCAVHRLSRRARGGGSLQRAAPGATDAMRAGRPARPCRAVAR